MFLAIPSRGKVPISLTYRGGGWRGPHDTGRSSGPGPVVSRPEYRWPTYSTPPVRDLNVAGVFWGEDGRDDTPDPDDSLLPATCTVLFRSDHGCG